MDPIVQMMVTIACTVIASSGFWAYLINQLNKKDLKSEMLLGLGHDRIIFLGLCYIDRGWISQDEYENLNEYLYRPYQKMNGNGTAKRIMDEVNRLPIRIKTEFKSECNL